MDAAGQSSAEFLRDVYGDQLGERVFIPVVLQ